MKLKTTYKFGIYFMKKIFLILLFILNTISIVNAQWKHTNGPYGSGSVKNIAINGSKIYAGTGNGVYMSTDNGESWKLIGLYDYDILSIAICGNAIFAGAYGWGIYKSIDDGANWTEVNTGIPGYIIPRTLTVNGSKIYVGLGSSGVFLSTNYGVSWNPLNKGIEKTDVRTILIKNNNLFVGTYNSGVFLSIDNGNTWNAINSGLKNTQVYVLTCNDTTIFAGTSYGVYLSNNYGVSWSEVNTCLKNSYVQAMTVCNSIIYAGSFSEGIMISKDNGASWIASNKGMTGQSITSFAVSGNNVFAGCDIYVFTHGGVFLSNNNGNSWKMKGVTNSNIRTIIVDNSNIFAGTLWSGMYFSNNYGASWNAINDGLKNTQINTLLKDGNNIFAGTEKGVFLSSNNGTNWTEAKTGIENISVRSLAINGTTIFVGAYYDGIFLSTNNGSTWTPANTGLTNKNVLSLVVNNKKIYAGTDGSGIYISTDNGKNWIQSNTGLPDYPQVRSITVINDKIFIALGNGVYLSTDNCKSWKAVSNGLSQNNIFSLAKYGTSIFAATYNGVYVSKDFGMNWVQANNGLTNTNVYAIAVDSMYVYAGTWDGGIFNRRLMLIANNETICSGYSATLTAKHLLGSDSTSVYKWDNGVVGNTITVSPKATTTYMLTVTNNNFSDISQAVVTMNSLPVLSSNNRTICNGDSIYLFVYGANTYLWNTGNTNSSIRVKPTNTTTYSIIGFKPGIGCSDTTQAIVKVTIPVTPVITKVADTLKSIPCVGCTNLWYKDSIRVYSSYNNKFIYKQNGDYFAISYLDGCISDTSNIIHVLDVSIEELKKYFEINPNPTKDYINVNFNSKIESYRIYNLMGQAIEELSPLKGGLGVYNIDVSNFIKGIYIIELTTKDGVVKSKFVKE